MGRTRLLRLFWIGAAAILVAAALVALVSVVAGSFDETDGRILGTLGTALLAGAVATAGSALVEARLAAAFGAAAAASAPVWFVVAAVALWRDFDGDLGRGAASGYVVLTAELVVATARLLVGRRRLLPLFAATAGCVALASALSVAAIWRSHAGGGAVKAIAAFWILGVLGYLLIPVARRLAGGPPAHGGPRRVDLGAGVELGRMRIGIARPGGAPARESLYVVVSGGARVGGLDLGPGDAAVVPAGTPAQLDAGSRVVTVEPR